MTGESKRQPRPPAIAYFSMEAGVEPSIPTYSGGLGILAGDTLRAAADTNVPMVGMTLLHRRGYFKQRLDSDGNQYESPHEWSPESVLEPVKPVVSIFIEGHEVRVRAWRYVLRGETGHSVPVYFLDSSLQGNTPPHRVLTDYLYGGDERYRLCQEAILGLGGVAMLRALGYTKIRTFHMNEGHSSLLTLALLNEYTESNQEASNIKIRDAIRQKCVFTTHTPVPAGHDKFSLDLVERVLGKEQTKALKSADCLSAGTLNMTYLALYFSRYINGVAMRHGKVSRGMYPEYPINSITNGVHAATWTSKPFQDLFDRYIPEWRSDNLYLRYAISIPLNEIREAHALAKRSLFSEIENRASVRLDPNVMTLGFARRATSYKRADLLLSDPERVKRIVRHAGPLQIVYGGKAHPRDGGGKRLIQKVFEVAKALKEYVQVVYLENYDMTLGRYVCSGVDVWVNTPQKPQEASGTSGMKAAINGVPSLSILDGWWVEGHVEGVTGWSIGNGWQDESDKESDANSLYDKLEYLVLPTYYARPDAFADIMRSAIAINGSFFNAQRMISQYVNNAYRLS